MAKSVCHRDRRSLPSRQLRCLCRTDFGSPYIIRDICANRLSRDPVPGVAKSVCHRDRRSLPNRQLRCLCRTDFGSPLNYTNSTFPQYIQAVAPIYIERVGLIYITIPDGGLPAVILNLVRDDLRMMAPKPVVARAGGMKDIADNCDYYP